jgi:hypothetical protein
VAIEQETEPNPGVRDERRVDQSHEVLDQPVGLHERVPPSLLHATDPQQGAAELELVGGLGRLEQRAHPRSNLVGA